MVALLARTSKGEVLVGKLKGPKEALLADKSKVAVLEKRLEAGRRLMSAERLQSSWTHFRLVITPTDIRPLY